MTTPKRKAGGPIEPQITDDTSRRRYEARLDGELAGWVEYGRVQNRLVALHTEVLPEYEGRGVASALVRHVLAAARSAGDTITPRCPFFARHFERHPEDHDVLAPPRAARRGDEARGS